jgi:hypothetical protein
VIEYFRSVGDLETADFVIVSAELNRLPAYHPVRDVAARGTPVAVFGSGTLEVRQTSRGDAATTTVNSTEAAGRDLSRQVPVRLTPEAWSTLVEGDVDARLITLLGRLAEKHTIDVASFERDAATSRADGPARVAVLTAADSELVSPSSPRVRRLMADIDDLPDDVRPAKVDIEKRAAGPMLIIRYLLPVGTS